MFQSFEKRFGQSGKQDRRKRKNRASLAVEPLEDRVVPSVAPSWFPASLGDPGIQSTAATLYAASGNALTRTDMIQILQKAVSEDGMAGKITSQQIKDFQTLVNNGSTLGMTPDVIDLASKVVDANPANVYVSGDPTKNAFIWGDPTLYAYPGNLATSSTGTQLDELVGMWFYGTDLPALAPAQTNSGCQYQVMNGSLFNAGGPIAQDVQQYLGDCWFLNAAEAIANTYPTALESMVTNNGDGTYTFRFFNDAAYSQTGKVTWDYVTVNRELPVLPGTGMTAYSAHEPTGALWAPLLEKAYTQILAEDWSFQCIMHGDADSYVDMGGGWIGYAEQDILGATPDYNVNVTSQASVNAALARGDIITWGQQSHAYAVLGYDSVSNTYTVDNPYSTGPGAGEYQYSWGQMENALADQMGSSASTPLPGDDLGPAPPLASVWPTVSKATSLSVNVPSGTADASSLIFSWRYVFGPAPVTFSANNSNAAQSTTATYTHAGSYELQMTVFDPVTGLQSMKQFAVNVGQGTKSITLTPSSTTVGNGGTVQFKATGTDQFGNPIVPGSLYWHVMSGGGTISPSGLYTAPASGTGTVTIECGQNPYFVKCSITLTGLPPTGPSVTKAAAATTNPTTVNLSVLGTDPAGAAGLTYTWSLLGGPAGVSFSANASNAAQNTTATVSKAGTYLFQALITDPSGNTTTSEVAVTILQRLTRVAVTSGAPVSNGATHQFTAVGYDQFGNVMPTPPIYWSVSGLGTVTPDGLYTAPLTGSGSATIQAWGDGASYLSYTTPVSKVLADATVTVGG